MMFIYHDYDACLLIFMSESFLWPLQLGTGQVKNMTCCPVSIVFCPYFYRYNQKAEKIRKYTELCVDMHIFFVQCVLLRGEAMGIRCRLNIEHH